MSQAASQASAFYKQVAKGKRVWTVRDDNGYPAPMTSSGQRAQPFWSSLARVKKIIKTAPAYSKFRPHEISWEDFTQKWVPGLTKDKLLVGVNWSGSKAVGYDLQPIDIQRNVETQRNSEPDYLLKALRT